MNAEVEQAAPTPADGASVTGYGALVLIVIIIAVAIHFILNRKKLMTDDTLSESLSDGVVGGELPAPAPKPFYSPEVINPPALAESTRRQLVQEQVPKRPASEQGAYATSVVAAPAESSINDVHRLREQDQALAQLRAQYEDMAAPPWAYASVKQLGNAGDVKTVLGSLTMALSAMMTPLSVAGEQRGTSAKGTLWYMNVGANKVGAESKAKCAEIHQRLNDEYYALVEPRRKAILQSIIDISKEHIPELRGEELHVAKCGQTVVMCLTKEDAELMAKRLNASYFAIIYPQLERVLAEIRTEASK